jgi:hypothetical protein
MCAKRQVSATPMVDLLRRAAPGKSKALDDLMASLHPKLQFDSDESRIMFCADSGSNTLTVGVPFGPKHYTLCGDSSIWQCQYLCVGCSFQHTKLRFKEGVLSVLRTQRRPGQVLPASQ